MVRRFVREVKQILENSQSTPEQVEKAVTDLCTIFCVWENPPVHEVLEADVLRILVHRLTKNTETSNFYHNAALVLAKIARSSENGAVAAIVRAGAIKPLLLLLRYFHPEVQNVAVSCISLIAADSIEFRDILLERGVLEPLLEIITKPSSLSKIGAMSLLDAATLAVGELCDGNPSPDLALVEPAAPYLNKILEMEVSEETKFTAAYALHSLNESLHERDLRNYEHNRRFLQPYLVGRNNQENVATAVTGSFYQARFPDW